MTEVKDCLDCRPASELSEEDIPYWSKKRGNYSPYPKMVTCDEKYNLEERENYINYITPKLKESDIDFVSAYEHFLNGNPYLTITENYIYNDIHFNDNGNKLLSDIIWSKIANN